MVNNVIIFVWVGFCILLCPFVVNAEETALRPSFSLPSGRYTEPQVVTITDAMPNSTIEYSITSGGHQTPWAVYTNPITLGNSSTIQAVASAPNHHNSNLTIAEYTILASQMPKVVARPSFSPPPGTYATPQTVTITDATNYATIYFSVESQGHQTPWALYNGPIAVGSGIATIQAVATPNGSLPNYESSPLETVRYTITTEGSGSTTGPVLPAAINGACGIAKSTCVTGAVANTSDNGTNTTWSCIGSNGGSQASCSIPDPINGVCGSSNHKALLQAPASNLCSEGQSSAVVGAGPWSWTCSGINSGLSVSCSANLEKTPLVLPTISLPPISPNATTYYVNATTGNDLSHNGLSATDAFRTIHKATSTMKGGDVVLVASGTYNESIKIFVSGTPDGYTTIMGMPGQARPIIISSPRVYSPSSPKYGDTIDIEASYVRVSGFDASWQYDTTLPNIYGNAIGECCAKALVNGVPQVMQHHLFVDNNIAHDSPGGGLNFGDSDYITLLGNTVYNNAYNAPGEYSGISVYESVNYDTAPSFHIIIMNNVSYHNIDGALPNYTLPDGRVVQGTCTTDGNGIIIDDSRRSQSVDKVPYTGSVLIMGNLAFGNGGRGITIYESDNVEIVNNTSYHNIQDPQLCMPSKDGDIRVAYSGGISLYNNIVVSAGVANALVDIGTANDVAQSNIFFGGPIADPASTSLIFNSANLFGIDPQMVAPSINPATANFHLNTSSPVLGQGIPFNSMESDISGNTVQANDPVNIGAYFK